MSIEKRMIRNAHINYAWITKPALKKDQEEDLKYPFKGKEYVADLCITPQDYKALKKKYTKAVLSIKNVKELSATQYKKAYKVEPPKGYEDEDGNFLVIKLRCHASASEDRGYKPNPAPELSATKKRQGKFFDNLGNEIDDKTLLGNGTKVNVIFRERKYGIGTQQGLSLDLSKVQVVEFVKFASNNDFDYDDDGSDLEEASSEEAQEDFSYEEDSSEGSPETPETTPEDDDWDE